MKIKKIMTCILAALTITASAAFAPYNTLAADLYPSAEGCISEYTNKADNDTYDIPERYIAGYADSLVSNDAAETGAEPNDSHTQVMCTPPKDQGSHNVCWAFAAASDYEAAIMEYSPAEGKKADISENHMRYATSPDGGNKYAGSDRKYDGRGNYKTSMMYYLRDVCGGPVPEEDDPYSDKDGIRDAEKTIEISEKYRMDYYPTKAVCLAEKIDPKELMNGSEPDERLIAFQNAVKEQVMDNGAVQVSYSSGGGLPSSGTEALYNGGTAEYGYTYYTSDSTVDHAVCIVGWDDSVPASAFRTAPPENGKGAWLVKNSWGEEWGNNGYFWMSYYTPLESVYSIDNVTRRSGLFDKMNAHDNAVCESAYGNTLKTIYFNKYTAQDGEVLSAIGTYLGNDSAYYKLYVSEDGTPENLSPVEIKTGDLKLAGETENGYLINGRWSWYMFELKSPIKLNGDYLVGIEISPVDGGKTMCVVNKNFSQAGRSFQCTGGAEQAYDENNIADLGAGSNHITAVIRAYTRTDEVIEIPDVLSKEGFCRAGDELTADYDSRYVISGNKVICALEPTEIYAETDSANIKWSLLAPNGKTSVSARFSNGLTYKLTTISSVSKVKIGNLKSNGKFNNTVTLRATSTIDGSVAAECVLYINPALVTEYKIKPREKVFEPVSGKQYEYDLKINENVKYQLPITALDGADKTLLYEVYGTHFTAINGTVRGLAATDTPEKLIIKPLNGTAHPITVNVNILPVTRVTRANVKNMTLFGSETQKFTINAIPLSPKVTYVSASYDKANLRLSCPTAELVVINKVNVYKFVGAAEFEVSLLNKNSVITSKNNKIKFNFLNDDASPMNRSIVIKVTAAKVNEYTNVVNFKESISKKGQYATVNIPEGNAGALGISLFPVTADNRFRFEMLSGDPDGISITGDVVTAKKTGTYLIRAVSNGIDQYGHNIYSNIYQINVYKPAGSIIWTDKSYTVKGGFLMPVQESEKSGSRDMQGGQVITVKKPVIISGENETVLWYKAGLTGIEMKETDDELTFELVMPGIYTITGISDKTNQKYVFKISVTAIVQDTPFTPAQTCELQYLDDNGQWAPISGLESMKKGQAAQLRMFSKNGVCGSVTYTSSNSRVLTVNNSGYLKAVSDTGCAEITAVMTGKSTAKKIVPPSVEKSITIFAEPVDITVRMLPIPSFVQARKEFKVRAEIKYAPEGTKPEWKCVNSNGRAYNLEVNGKITSIDTPGTYTIYPVIGGIKGNSYEITVYKTVPTTVKAMDPSPSLTLQMLRSKDSGISPGKTVNIPITAYAYDKKTKTNIMADPDEISWVSSNSYAATVKSVSSGAADKYAVATISISKDTQYKGLVTLTGVLKNSGRKLLINIYIV